MHEQKVEDSDRLLALELADFVHDPALELRARSETNRQQLDRSYLLHLSTSAVLRHRLHLRCFGFSARFLSTVPASPQPGSHHPSRSWVTSSRPPVSSDWPPPRRRGLAPRYPSPRRTAKYPSPRAVVLGRGLWEPQNKLVRRIKGGAIAPPRTKTM